MDRHEYWTIINMISAQGRYMHRYQMSATTRHRATLRHANATLRYATLKATFIFLTLRRATPRYAAPRYVALRCVIRNVPPCAYCAHPYSIQTDLMDLEGPMSDYPLDEDEKGNLLPILQKVSRVIE